MADGRYEYQSDFAKKHFGEGLAKGRDEGLAKGRDEGLAKGRDEGLAKGRDEGLAKGRDEGLAKGRDEGRAEGRASALLRLLSRRFGAVSEAVLAKVQAASIEQLDRWLDAAVDAESVEGVFSATESD